jgi:peptide/nickel transport system permease protein
MTPESHVLSNVVVALVVLAGLGVAAFVRRSPQWRDAARRIWRRRPVAVVVVGLYVLVALADSIAWIGGADAVRPRSIVDRLFPVDFQERSYSAPLASHDFVGEAPLRYPRRHLLGTDILGRDVLRMTLKGARVALLIGGLTTLIIIPVALLFGVSAGYFGGAVDTAVFFVMSTLASIPGILLLTALIMVLGVGTVQVCVALGITGWVGFCRIARGETLKVRELDYVQAARALGAGAPAIMLRHVVPNLMHLVLITFVLTFSGLVLSEAVLSWLGLGIAGSWGQMIDQARDELARDPVIWWNLLAAASALFGLILAVNVLGDAVRDVLDPRSARP